MAGNSLYSTRALAALLVLCVRISKDDGTRTLYGSFDEQIADFNRFFQEGTQDEFLLNVHKSFVARQDDELKPLIDAVQGSVGKLLTTMHNRGMWSDCGSVRRSHIFQLAGIQSPAANMTGGGDPNIPTA